MNALTALLVTLFWSSLALSQNKIEVMFYNVENLFDTVHDEGKRDWEFTPKGPRKKEGCKGERSSSFRRRCMRVDWGKKKLAIKLKQIRDIIMANRSDVPDILGLVEVENENVLRMLADILGYKNYIITDGPDVRGIDVAILYKGDSLNYVDHESYRVTGKALKGRSTRDILEVSFIANKVPLYVYVNHWPSQGNPSGARVLAAKALLKAVGNRQKSEPNARILVMGDFNTLPTDYPHPFDSLFGKQELVDIHNLFLKMGSDAIIKNMPLGTYFYTRTMSWNLFDRIFVGPNLLNAQKGPRVDVKSYRMSFPKFARTKHTYKKNTILKGSVITNIPKRYNFQASNKSAAGYSDHIPVTVNLLLK